MGERDRLTAGRLACPHIPEPWGSARPTTRMDPTHFRARPLLPRLALHGVAAWAAVTILALASPSRADIRIVDVQWTVERSQVRYQFDVLSDSPLTEVSSRPGSSWDELALNAVAPDATAGGPFEAYWNRSTDIGAGVVDPNEAVTAVFEAINEAGERATWEVAIDETAYRRALGDAEVVELDGDFIPQVTVPANINCNPDYEDCPSGNPRTGWRMHVAATCPQLNGEDLVVEARVLPDQPTNADICGPICDRMATPSVRGMGSIDGFLDVSPYAGMTVQIQITCGGDPDARAGTTMRVASDPPSDWDGMVPFASWHPDYGGEIEPSKGGCATGRSSGLGFVGLVAVAFALFGRRRRALSAAATLVLLSACGGEGSKIDNFEVQWRSGPDDARFAIISEGYGEPSATPVWTESLASDADIRVREDGVREIFAWYGSGLGDFGTTLRSRRLMQDDFGTYLIESDRYRYDRPILVAPHTIREGMMWAVRYTPDPDTLSPESIYGIEYDSLDVWTFWVEAPSERADGSRVWTVRYTGPHMAFVPEYREDCTSEPVPKTVGGFVLVEGRGPDAVEFNFAYGEAGRQPEPQGLDNGGEPTAAPERIPAPHPLAADRGLAGDDADELPTLTMTAVGDGPFREEFRPFRMWRVDGGENRIDELTVWGATGPNMAILYPPSGAPITAPIEFEEHHCYGLQGDAPAGLPDGEQGREFCRLPGERLVLPNGEVLDWTPDGGDSQRGISRARQWPMLMGMLDGQVVALHDRINPETGLAHQAGVHLRNHAMVPLGPPGDVLWDTGVRFSTVQYPPDIPLFGVPTATPLWPFSNGIGEINPGTPQGRTGQHGVGGPVPGGWAGWFGDLDAERETVRPARSVTPGLAQVWDHNGDRLFAIPMRQGAGLAFSQFDQRWLALTVSRYGVLRRVDVGVSGVTRRALGRLDLPAGHTAMGAVTDGDSVWVLTYDGPSNRNNTGLFAGQCSPLSVGVNVDHFRDRVGDAFLWRVDDVDVHGHGVVDDRSAAERLEVAPNRICQPGADPIERLTSLFNGERVLDESEVVRFGNCVYAADGPIVSAELGDRGVVTLRANHFDEYMRPVPLPLDIDELEPDGTERGLDVADLVPLADGGFIRADGRRIYADDLETWEQPAQARNRGVVTRTIVAPGGHGVWEENPVCGTLPFEANCPDGADFPGAESVYTLVSGVAPVQVGGPAGLPWALPDGSLTGQGVRIRPDGSREDAPQLPWATYHPDGTLFATLDDLTQCGLVDGVFVCVAPDGTERRTAEMPAGFDPATEPLRDDLHGLALPIEGHLVVALMSRFNELNRFELTVQALRLSDMEVLSWRAELGDDRSGAVSSMQFVGDTLYVVLSSVQSVVREHSDETGDYSWTTDEHRHRLLAFQPSLGLLESPEGVRADGPNWADTRLYVTSSGARLYPAPDPGWRCPREEDCALRPVFADPVASWTPLTDDPQTCLPTNEVCNGVDDDCDGAIDETDDPLCSWTPSADAVCQDGTCVLTGCHDGWEDCDGEVESGCETWLLANDNCGGCDVWCPEGTGCANFECVGGFSQVRGASDAMCAASEFGQILCHGTSRVGRGRPGVPVRVGNDGPFASTTFTRVEIGETVGCAQTDLGHLYCWGLPENREFPGRPTTYVPMTNPDAMSVLSGVSDFATGNGVIAYIRDGAVYCTGDDCAALTSSQQLGTATDYEQVIAGGEGDDWFVCARRSNDRVDCIGTLRLGLTDEWTTQSFEATYMRSGWNNAAFLSDTEWKVIGNVNAYRSLPAFTDFPEFTSSGAITTFAASEVEDVVTGQYFVCVLRTDGTAACSMDLTCDGGATADADGWYLVPTGGSASGIGATDAGACVIDSNGVPLCADRDWGELGCDWDDPGFSEL